MSKKKLINNNYVTCILNLISFFLLIIQNEPLEVWFQGILKMNIIMYQFIYAKNLLQHLKDQLRKFIPPTLHAYFVFLKEYSIFTMVWTSLFDVYYLPMLYKQDIEGKQENLVKLGNAFVRRFNNLVNTYSIIRTIYSVACKFERKIIIDIWKRNRSSRLIYWMNRSTRTSLKHFPKYNFIFCRGEIELIGIEK